MDMDAEELKELERITETSVKVGMKAFNSVLAALAKDPAFAKNLAQITNNIYTAHIENGFVPNEALMLTTAQISAMSRIK